jgi:hypothetical protein
VPYRHDLGELDIDLVEFSFQSRAFGNTEGYFGLFTDNTRGF